MKRPALHVNTHFLSQKKVWGILLLIAVAIGAYYIFSRKEGKLKIVSNAPELVGASALS